MGKFKDKYDEALMLIYKKIISRKEYRIISGLLYLILVIFLVYSFVIGRMEWRNRLEKVPPNIIEDIEKDIKRDIKAE